MDTRAIFTQLSGTNYPIQSSTPSLASDSILHIQTFMQFDKVNIYLRMRCKGTKWSGKRVTQYDVPILLFDNDCIGTEMSRYIQ